MSPSTAGAPGGRSHAAHARSGGWVRPASYQGRLVRRVVRRTACAVPTQTGRDDHDRGPIAYAPPPPPDRWWRAAGRRRRDRSADRAAASGGFGGGFFAAASSAAARAARSTSPSRPRTASSGPEPRPRRARSKTRIRTRASKSEPERDKIRTAPQSSSSGGQVGHRLDGSVRAPRVLDLGSSGGTSGSGATGLRPSTSRSTSTSRGATGGSSSFGGPSGSTSGSSSSSSSSELFERAAPAPRRAADRQLDRRHPVPAPPMFLLFGAAAAPWSPASGPSAPDRQAGPPDRRRPRRTTGAAFLAHPSPRRTNSGQRSAQDVRHGWRADIRNEAETVPRYSTVTTDAVTTRRQ